MMKLRNEGTGEMRSVWVCERSERGEIGLGKLFVNKDEKVSDGLRRAMQ